MGREKIDEPISVSFLSDYRTHKIVPVRFLWKKRIFQVEEIGLHHTYYQGDVLYHVFSVVCNSAYFRLALNTQTLLWRLEEVGSV